MASRTGPRWLVVGLLALIGSVAHAEPVRLSDWLLAHPPGPGDYPAALLWQVDDEVPRQEALRQALLRDLDAATAQAARRLRDLIEQMPATGRVPLRSTDPRWLQAWPVHDPVLREGQQVRMPRRPRTVSVITGLGQSCRIEHAPGASTRAYVEVCAGGATDDIDWVWVAQPEGRIQRHGIAGWNAGRDDEPAPGAWLWAPGRDQGWSERLGERLIAFLATQGPAPDESGLPASSVRLSPGAPAARRADGAFLAANDWGGTGALQTPSARMREAGYLGLHISHAHPYLHGNVTLQPLDALEVSFRYSDIAGQLYGAAIAGTQNYKDKSINLKLRLTEEDARWPALAIGLQDLTGTGLFSSEYLVASKRTGPFDWSAGLAWGYLGGRGTWANPMGRVASGFNDRIVNIGQGGNFSLSSYFHGRMAPFASIQAQTPWESLVARLEYDGNDYRHEPFGMTLRQRTPFNAGLVYRLLPAVDLSAGLERGTTVMLALTMQTGGDRMSVLKLGEPARLRVNREPPATGPADWAVTRADLEAQTHWQATRIEQSGPGGRDLVVRLADPEANYLRERIDRAMSVLHRDAPPEVERMTLVMPSHGIEAARYTVDRDLWVREQTEALPPRAARVPVTGRGAAMAEDDEPNAAPRTRLVAPAERFESALGMGWQQNLGGPDAFLLYQVSATERFKLRISESLWVQGFANLGLINNYERFRYDAPSNLPRVRTYLREYLTTDRLTLPNLQITGTGQWGADHHWSLYAGYLESMFGGAGGEWLYRPFASRVAFGIDVNVVQQRDFRQDLGFGEAGAQSGYRVATGHATLYWDTGWQGVRAQVSAGRYLARDVGATFQVGRVFDNGVQMGAYFTKTNVSAAQFGEGSFDKGIFVSIPFDAMSTRSSGSTAMFQYHPLVRDGGARLDRAVTLMDLTRLRDRNALRLRDPEPDEALPGREQPDRARADRVREIDQWLRRRETTEAFTQVESWRVGGGAALERREADALIAALASQDFDNVRVSLDAQRVLQVSVTRDRVESAAGAIGRVARTAMRIAPLETRALQISYARRGAPAVSASFADLTQLAAVLDGRAAPATLEATTRLTWHDPSLREREALACLAPVDEPIEGHLANADLMTTVLPEPGSIDRLGRDLTGAWQGVRNIDGWTAGGLLAGSVLSAALLDARADRFASRHAGASWLKAGVRVGNALPWAGLAAAGLLALEPGDPERARTAWTATEAGGASLALALGLKYAVGRARPGETPGTASRNFSPFGRGAHSDAFPSNHTIVAWSVATPFALAYDAPWLYGVAAITNGARVGSRAHWLSDTVASSALGHGVGRIFWQASRDGDRDRPSAVPQVALSPSSVTLAWGW